MKNPTVQQAIIQQAIAVSHICDCGRGTINDCNISCEAIVDQHLELSREFPTLEQLRGEISCHTCKYLLEEDETDTWLRSGEKKYYCDNEAAIFDIHEEELDPDCMDEYPDTCYGWSDRDAA